MPHSVYTLNSKTFAILANLGIDMHCCRCGKELKLGDRIVSKRGGKYRTKLYHKNCAKELHII